ncbi:MAG: phosphotransferase [Armatimonadetes bacterium]|nr:phosphotransferase [Armatimonadota bacterium]
MASPDTREIIGAVCSGFGIELTRLEPVEGGLDAQAVAFRGSSANGDFFVKWRKNLPPGLRLVADLDIPEVLSPLKSVTGEPWVTVSDGALLIYPYVEGKNGFELRLEPEHWRSVGRTLRRVHEFKEAQEVPNETFTVEGIDEFRATAIQTPAQEILCLYSEAVETCLQRVVELGARCRAKEWHLVPCHADIHVGNILVREDGPPLLVDWDAPKLAPKECDLMFFCGPGITGHEPEVEGWFFEGYGQCQIDPLALAYYRHVRAVEDIVSFTRESCDPSRTDESLRFLSGIFKPRQIVQTADESYRLLSR